MSRSGKRLGRLLLVADLDVAEAAGVDLEGAVAAALPSIEAGGALLQLRGKGRPAQELVRHGRRLLRLTQDVRIPLVVNDRIDVALAIAADGAHLPESGLTIPQARALARRPFLLGASTHDETSAGAAARDGADYVVFGPAWPTDSKAGKQELGETAVQELARAIRDAGSLPFAIGGINAERAARCRALGCHGAAAIRHWLLAKDPARAVAELMAALES